MADADSRMACPGVTWWHVSSPQAILQVMEATDKTREARKDQVVAGGTTRRSGGDVSRVGKRVTECFPLPLSLAHSLYLIVCSHEEEDGKSGAGAPHSNHSSALSTNRKGDGGLGKGSGESGEGREREREGVVSVRLTVGLREHVALR